MTYTNGNPGKEKDARGYKRAWPLFVGLPLIILIAVAAVVFSGGGDRAPQDQRTGEKGAAGGDRELGHPALGEAGAPVVMIEYGDYQ